MKWINGNKSYVGTIAGSILGMVIASGLLSWESPVTQIIALAITGFTGVAFAHKGNKILKKLER